MPKAICQSHRGCYECLPQGEQSDTDIGKAERLVFAEGDPTHPYIKIMSSLLSCIYMLHAEIDEIYHDRFER